MSRSNCSTLVSNAAAVGCALALLWPAIAWAHPGHGSGFLSGLAHPFLGIDHLLAAIAVGAWGTRIGGRALWALPAVFVTSMLAGGVLGYVGIAIPAIELLIAASVLALGLVLSISVSATIATGMSIVFLFGLFHGVAHGLEVPSHSNMSAYALGLGIATISLHACGIGVAVLARAHTWLLRVAAAPIALAGIGLLASRLG